MRSGGRAAFLAVDRLGVRERKDRRRDRTDHSGCASAWRRSSREVLRAKTPPWRAAQADRAIGPHRVAIAARAESNLGTPLAIPRPRSCRRAGARVNAVEPDHSAPAPLNGRQAPSSSYGPAPRERARLPQIAKLQADAPSASRVCDLLANPGAAYWTRPRIRTSPRRPTATATPKLDRADIGHGFKAWSLSCL